MGLPFLPVKGFWGSDYLRVRPDFLPLQDPFSGQEIIVVPPIRPEFCVFHGYAADEAGNVLMKRDADVDLAARAADKVIVSVEERVADVEAARRPQMKRLSWIYVGCLVEAPGGARPTACPGRYPADPEGYRAYLEAFQAGRLADYFKERVES